MKAWRSRPFALVVAGLLAAGCSSEGTVGTEEETGQDAGEDTLVEEGAANESSVDEDVVDEDAPDD